ncbi:MAG TPA: hypothetical protein VEG84_09205 [Thermoanaerobaculia bacterium]|nr:hypothetical protein [Thermoanaerobaculia bacterium]
MIAGLLAAAAVFAIAPAAATAEASASGAFSDQRVAFDVGGAYAFWDRTAGPGGGQVIRVAVSNDQFNARLFDDHYERALAIRLLFVAPQTRVVYFEFDESGKYLGLSYSFGPGAGCVFCSDGNAVSTVRAEDGRLAGELEYQGDDRQYRVLLDVPIPSKVWGDPLPASGGEPGRVYLAYHAALEKGDRKAVFALLDLEMKARWRRYEFEKKLDAYFDYRWEDMHGKMRAVHITGGFVRGGRAVVLFTGKSDAVEALHGEALLREEDGSWFVHHDMVDVGWR